MRAVRLGSYSIAATFAGTPNLLRLKSMRRYARLAPPPRWRVVILPWLLRPECFFKGTISERSGFVFVISSNVDTDMPRRPGEVGRYCLTGIFCPLRLQCIDCFPISDGHNRLLPFAGFHRPRSGPTPPDHLCFTRHSHGVDRDDMHFKQLLYCAANFNFIGVQRYFKGILILPLQSYCLLSNDTVAQYFCDLHSFLLLAYASLCCVVALSLSSPAILRLASSAL